MKVSKEIQRKMHRLADLTARAGVLTNEIDEYFKKQGYDTDELRGGDGVTLDELDYGNDITDIFVENMENGKYEYCRNND